MATVDRPKPIVAAAARDRIYSPLHKLRGAIRRYIAFEALAVLINALAVWFWLGLICDYGFFRITGFDWAQLVSKYPRLGVQLLIAVGIIILTVWKLVILFHTYRPTSLALLLERRFPKLLGDRLITAVELSGNLDEADRLGYSRAMIVETVRKVAHDVDKVPVSQVFRWSRLRNWWLAAAFNTLGIFLLVAVAWLAWNRTANVVGFGYRFADITQIYAERNFFLMNTLWPRRSLLEVIDFPASGELRIQQGSSTNIRVRALKWVVADRNAPGGWRALTWHELDSNLIGIEQPALPVAALVPLADADRAPAPDSPHWTVDRVESLLETSDVRDRLAKAGWNEQQFAAFEKTLATLDRKAADPRMSRKLRKLVIPQTVTMHYWGKKTSNKMALTRQQEINEFAGVVADLKESVKFYVTGEDFRTFPDLRITLVPPPAFTKLERDEYLPAYLYHRAPADGSLELLKGLKQVRENVGISLTGSTSRFEVPSGTDIVIRGETDKELTQARIRFRGAKGAAGTPETPGIVENIDIGPDRRSIEKRFDHINRPLEFDFELTDTDNVKSLRHMIIQPVEDRSPEVNVAIDTIRKTPQGYMCTPQAMIPLTGMVRDDSGLTRVEYVISYSRFESSQAVGIRAAIAAGVFGTISPGPTMPESFTAPMLVGLLTQMSESREGMKTPQPLVLKTFQEIADERDREFRYGKEQLQTKLRETPAQNVMIRQYDIKPNLEWLDLLEQVKDLQVGANDTIRPRFRMRLTVSATDNNVETGPRTGQNKETFTFLVVPHEELMGEMNKDEEALSYKLDDLIRKMADVRADIEKTIERIPVMAGDDGFRASASRAQEMEEAVAKGRDVTQEVFTDYSRLFKEAQTNRLPASFVEQKEKIVSMLDEALRQHFPRAEEAHGNFKKILEDRRPPDTQELINVRQRQDELLLHLRNILDRMGQVLGVSRLAKQLTELISAKILIQAKLTDMLKKREDIELDRFGFITLKGSPVELAKGEKRVLLIQIERDQVDGELELRLEAPKDSGLTLPASVIVPRLSTQASFEVSAGDKTGEFGIPIAVLNTDGEPVKWKDPKQPFVLKVKVK